ncbi:MAG: hypothetical protein HS100_18920 [Anaerolineales bacterium]|nr:hypothetical protein [Anaerolineales bacterium]
MNYTDPSGHICVESDGDSDVGMAGNCNGGSNPKHKPGLQGPKWNPRLGNSDDESQGGDIGDGPELGAGITKSDKPIPLCEQTLTHSSCQTISNTVGVTVFVLDGVAFVGTGVFAALAVSSIAGGPIGLGTVMQGYKIANEIEGRIGTFTFGLTLANDVLITGNTNYSSAKSEFTISSDTVIAGTFAGAGGFYSEPFGDTFLNGVAVIHDYYRVTGGEKLFDLHIAPGRIYLTDSHYPDGLNIWP